MGILRVFTILLTISLAVVATVRAQTSEDLSKFNRQVVRLYQAGKYADAILIARQALQLVEQKFGPDHPNVGTTLNNLALLYHAQGRYAEAKPLYKRTIIIVEKALGPDHPNVGAMLNNLAGLYESQGRYEEAEPLHKRSLSIREKALGPDHPDVGQSLNNLASVYHAQGRYEEAEPLYKRSLSIRKKALGPDHSDVGQSLNNLALLYGSLGRHAEAEPLHKRSLSIREKALGPDHPDVGQSLNNLAMLYGAQSRYAEAEPLYKRSLSISEKTLGPDHPNVGSSLNNLAALHQSQGRYAEADPLYKRSLSISEKALGPDHPNVGKSLNNLAELYRLQGRYAEAEPLYKRSLSIREKALGPEHSNVGTILNNLARLYKKTGQSVEETKVRERLARLPPAGTRHIPVYFATTRVKTDQKGLYGTNDGNTIAFGRATMQVPAEVIQKQGKKRADAIGQLGQSREKLSVADVFKRVRHRLLSVDQITVSLKSSMSRSALFKQQALIFVHGFNVDFDEATQRISQVAFDLEFDGALIAFSWASLGRGDPVAYASDRGRADKSVARFVALLDQMSTRFPNVTFHIMAHSMGNRILTRALYQIAERPEGAKRPNLGEVILAHADVDPEWCEKLGKARPFVRGITNYVNQDDWALWIAEGLRLGKSRCGRFPRVYDGIETIDTTGIGGRGSVRTLVTGTNHHGVFANDPLLFGEITRLIATGQRPTEKRTPELVPRKDKDGGIYWVYDKSKDITAIAQAAE